MNNESKITLFLATCCSKLKKLEIDLKMDLRKFKQIIKYLFKKDKLTNFIMVNRYNNIIFDFMNKNENEKKKLKIGLNIFLNQKQLNIDNELLIILCEDENLNNLNVYNGETVCIQKIFIDFFTVIIFKIIFEKISLKI